MKISVVSPIYNEQEAVQLFVQELYKNLTKLDCDFEVILVDDGSEDHSWKVIEGLTESLPDLRAIRLMHNYGKDIAIYTGLDQITETDFVVILDSDLQHPPELIVNLIENLRKGCDIVYAVKSARPVETTFSRLSAVVFYRLVAIIHKDITPLKTDFMAFTNFTRKALLALENKNLPLKGAILLLNPPATSIEFIPRNRLTGHTRWTFSKKLSLAIKLIFPYSAKPMSFLFRTVFASTPFYVGIGLLSLVQLLKAEDLFNNKVMQIIQAMSLMFTASTFLFALLCICLSFRVFFSKTHVSIKEFKSSVRE